MLDYTLKSRDYLIRTNTSNHVFKESVVKSDGKKKGEEAADSDFSGFFEYAQY